ncbi:MAG: SGNH/GDSL hydrolase family protein [Janthinobacterium lividum]
MAIGRSAAIGLAILAATGAAQAAPYTAAYVFGDSLSDNGNLAELLGSNFPNPPSYQDSFTNGPVANALLANQIGLTLTPSLWVTGFKDIHNLFGGASYVPGTNYAVAGATSAASPVGGLAPTINLPQQVTAFGAATGNKADPNALYVVEIGGNDIRQAALQGTGPAAVTAGVTAELQAVQTLAQDGAKKFLVVNAPNVGIIPEFTQDNASKAATATLYSQQYNAQLASGFSSLALPASTSVMQFDLYSYNSGLLANAGALGFSDTTDRCFTSTPSSAATIPQCGPNGANISQFFYWDSIHPSARVQALWATGFENALGLTQVASVPEPGSLALLAVGIAGLVGLGQRRKAATAA